MIFKCFPEININMENVWIYKTNIYMLYDDIVKDYKTLVAKETVIRTVVEFPHRLDDLLKNHLDVSSMQRRKICCNKLLNISDANSMAMIVQMALQGVNEEGKLLTTKYQLIDWIKRQKYTYASQTYWEYTRDMSFVNGHPSAPTQVKIKVFAFLYNFLLFPLFPSQPPALRINYLSLLCK